MLIVWSEGSHLNLWFACVLCRSKTSSGALIRSNATYCSYVGHPDYFGDVGEAACLAECEKLHCTCFDYKY